MLTNTAVLVQNSLDVGKGGESAMINDMKYRRGKWWIQL